MKENGKLVGPLLSPKCIIHHEVHDPTDISK